MRAHPCVYCNCCRNSVENNYIEMSIEWTFANVSYLLMLLVCCQMEFEAIVPENSYWSSALQLIVIMCRAQQSRVMGGINTTNNTLNNTKSSLWSHLIMQHLKFQEIPSYRIITSPNPDCLSSRTVFAQIRWRIIAFFLFTPSNNICECEIVSISANSRFHSIAIAIFALRQTPSAMPTLK